MNANKEKGTTKQGFDPFVLSLLTDQQKQPSMNPMMMNLLTSGKGGEIGPLMPLFMTGKTDEDPLLMMLLMVLFWKIQLFPKIVHTQMQPGNEKNILFLKK